jgi:hypothetical protein
MTFDTDILPSNGTYFFNNRSQESSFATLKANDKIFLSMMTERLGELAVTSINKTAEWLKS